MKKTMGAVIFLTILGMATPAYPSGQNPEIAIVDPQDAKACYNRGTAYYEKQDFDAAERELSRAIQLEPKAADAYFNRGLSFRRRHKIDEAISDFSKAIELYSKQPGYYFERANALILKNNYEAAIADASAAIRLSSQEPEIYFLRGLALMLNDDLERALADSIKALQMDPDYTDARRLLRETLLKIEIRRGFSSSNPYPSILRNKNVVTMPKNFNRESE